MTDSTDDVDWYDGYMDTPKRRKTKPLGGTYRKFKHLDRVLRGCATSTDPVHRAAAEMWAAIAKANAEAQRPAVAGTLPPFVEYGYRGPSIDHSILSPSGRCSKRARDAAMKRESARLFPTGFWDKPTPTAEEQAKQKADGLRLAAKTLRDLAARGMNRPRYTHEAAKLEAQADSLIANNSGHLRTTAGRT